MGITIFTLRTLSQPSKQDRFIFQCALQQPKLYIFCCKYPSLNNKHTVKVTGKIVGCHEDFKQHWLRHCHQHHVDFSALF
jgi:hypothetical protein